MMTETTLSCTAPSAQKKRRGFTLTEIAIVLGIIGLILGAVWAAAKNVYNNVGSAKSAEITSILIASVRGTYGNGQPTSGDLSGGFTSITYPLSATTTANAQITGDSIGGVAGFAIGFTDTTPYALGSGSVAASLCQGVAQAVLALPGTYAADVIGNLGSGGTGTCTWNGTSAVCPTKAGYSGSACNPGTKGNPGTCTYTQPIGGAGGACNYDGTNYVIQAFVPYQPS
jgi:prepilin-type N-terminal cleavage/methylation domain-containing protein